MSDPQAQDPDDGDPDDLPSGDGEAGESWRQQSGYGDSQHDRQCVAHSILLSFSSGCAARSVFPAGRFDCKRRMRLAQHGHGSIALTALFNDPTDPE